MIAILLSSLLFIFGLICTFTRIPTTRKFLATWFRSFPDQKTHSRDDITKASNPTAEIKYFKHSSSHKTDLKTVFATFDKNNDGYITKKELKESLKNIGIFAADRDVDDMIGKLDSNGDGLIDFNEFCMLFESISSGHEEQVLKEDGNDSDGDLKEAFDVFDGNKDGLITLEELGLVLSSLGFIEGNNEEDCKEMIKKVDADGDGMVNFGEFKKMMKTGIAS